MTTGIDSLLLQSEYNFAFKSNRATISSLQNVCTSQITDQSLYVDVYINERTNIQFELQ